MAVYTPIEADALAAFLREYDLGPAIAFKGIAEGVENSNFYLETGAGRFILTLFEKRVNPQDLPYFVALMQHLAGSGFACPRPVAGHDGGALRRLCGKHALIVTFLSGMSPSRPTAGECRALGAALARMHAALADFPQRRANSLGPGDWPALWQGRAAAAEALAPGLAALISADLCAIAQGWPAAGNLPEGTIHADLFPDNAFFLDGAFSGAIDFYFACTDRLAYDLGVCLNAWAFEAGGHYNFTRGHALIAGYESVRTLTSEERAALPLLARGAAMRFFLTRLVDWSAEREGAMVRPKNPLDYADRLRFHRAAQGPADYGA